MTEFTSETQLDFPSLDLELFDAPSLDKLTQ